MTVSDIGGAAAYPWLHMVGVEAWIERLSAFGAAAGICNKQRSAFAAAKAPTRIIERRAHR